MKNLYFLLIGSFILLIMAGCSKEAPSAKSFASNSDNDSEVCTIEVPCGIPTDHLISTSEAADMEDKFLKFYDDFNEIMQKDYGTDYEGPGTDVWFSLDDVKQYIAYVEKYADKKGYNNLGLRVYYGIGEQKGDTGEIESLMTVFFVPTALTSSGENENMTGIERMDYGHAGVKKGVKTSNLGIE